MRKLGMIFKVFVEWLLFPIVFPLWKMGLMGDGFANDYLFYHLCIYADITNKSITDVTKKTYRGLTPRLRLR